MADHEVFIGTVLRSTRSADVKADRWQRCVVDVVADDHVVLRAWLPNGHYTEPKTVKRTKTGKVAGYEVVHHPQRASRLA